MQFIFTFFSLHTKASLDVNKKIKVMVQFQLDFAVPRTISQVYLKSDNLLRTDDQ